MLSCLRDFPCSHSLLRKSEVTRRWEQLMSSLTPGGRAAGPDVTPARHESIFCRIRCRAGLELTRVETTRFPPYAPQLPRAPAAYQILCPGTTGRPQAPANNAGAEAYAEVLCRRWREGRSARSPLRRPRAARACGGYLRAAIAHFDWW